MRFSTIVFKNVARRPARSSLTVIAVAIAVGAVVALVGIANGFESTFRRLYEGVGVDLLVVRAGNTRRLTSSLEESLGDRIELLDGVVDVVPGLAEVISFSDYGLYVVPISGLAPETRIFDHLRIFDGRTLSKEGRREVLLGRTLAETLGKKAGESLEVVEGETFQVVGIFEADNVIEDGSVIMALHDLQKLMGREADVTGFSVITRDSSDKQLIQRLRKEIEALETGIVARPTQEHVSTLTEIQLAKAMAWLTSTVALVIGVVGLLNTMLMSVQERTREIGILRSLGWRKSLVVRLIIGESVLLSLLGAIVGVVGAMALVGILSRTPFVAGMIEFRFQPLIIMEGVAVALLLGLLGGALPARLAASLSPAEAVRHE